MEELLSTIVFLLPGFMMYFWLQSFGINSVVKHTSIELTAISALLWLPVASISLFLHNLIFVQENALTFIMSFENIQALLLGSLDQLLLFIIVSALVSFIIGAIWAKWGYILQLGAINLIRKWRGIAELSKTPSVWEEVFLKNKPQVIEFGRLGDEKNTIVGEIDKVSRPFEPDKNIYLRDMDYYPDLIERYKIPVSNIFIDTKSGTYIKIFSSKDIVAAISKEEATSLEEVSDQK